MNNDLYVVLLLGLAIIYLYKKNNKLFGGLKESLESDNPTVLQIQSDNPTVLQKEIDQLRKSNYKMKSKIDNDKEYIGLLEDTVGNYKMELNDIHTKYKTIEQELDNTKISSIFAYDKNKNGALDRNEFDEELLSKFKI